MSEDSSDCGSWYCLSHCRPWRRLVGRTGRSRERSAVPDGAVWRVCESGRGAWKADIRWHDLKLGDLVTYIQAAMPREHEFFVSAQSTREIVSLMLQESGIPPGKEPISSDAKRLDAILIARPAPAK